MEQRSLDWTGRDAKQEAIERVDRNADKTWKDEAYRLIIDVARKNREFTTDDVWSAGLPNTHENRALGAVMMRVAKEGLIERAGHWKKATRVAAHDRPMAVWTSRIFVW